MKLGWIAAGCLGVLVAAPAFAHELECVKTVNGETLLEVDSYPTTLTYSLTVRNIHPTSPSDVLAATDPLLELLGWEGFDTPFTLAVGAESTKTFDVNLEDVDACEDIAALDGTDDGRIDNTFTVTWDNGSDECSAEVVCVPPTPPPPGEIQGRFTGGGSVFGTGQNRVTHGFEIYCDPNDPRQNIEVNWQGNHFHMTDLVTASCTDNPALDEENPVAGFDTFTGTGTGSYNNVPGATIEFTFTDDGEPGVNDFAHIVIRDANGNVVLDVQGDLQFGNHQAHPT